MAFSTAKHDRVISKTLDDIQAGVYDNIKALEKEINDLVRTGYDPLVLRPQILEAFRRYSRSAGLATVGVTAISNSWLAQTNRNYTPQDTQAESLLVEQTARTVSATVDSYAEEVATVVALGFAGGVAANKIAERASAKISGVMFDSTDPETRRLQRQLRRMMSAGATASEYGSVIQKIKQRNADVDFSASLRDAAVKEVDNGVMNFQGAFAQGVGNREGITQWTYAGGIVKGSRPFCQAHVDNTYTLEEIESIWSGSWAGKEPGDPFVVRGGYNCIHYWVPVEPDEQA